MTMVLWWHTWLSGVGVGASVTALIWTITNARNGKDEQ